MDAEFVDSIWMANKSLNTVLFNLLITTGFISKSSERFKFASILLFLALLRKLLDLNI